MRIESEVCHPVAMDGIGTLNGNYGSDDFFDATNNIRDSSPSENGLENGLENSLHSKIFPQKSFDHKPQEDQKHRFLEQVVDATTESGDLSALCAPRRPRSRSNAFECLLPMAMMSPLLVASSPLTRSTPSLNSLKDDLMSTYNKQSALLVSNKEEQQTVSDTCTSASSASNRSSSSSGKSFASFKDDLAASSRRASRFFSLTSSSFKEDGPQSLPSTSNGKVSKGLPWGKKNFRSTVSSTAQPLLVPKSSLRRRSLQHSSATSSYDNDLEVVEGAEVLHHHQRISELVEDSKVSSSAPSYVPSIALPPLQVCHSCHTVLQRRAFLGKNLANSSPLE